MTFTFNSNNAHGGNEYFFIDIQAATADGFRMPQQGLAVTVAAIGTLATVDSNGHTRPPIVIGLATGP